MVKDYLEAGRAFLALGAVSFIIIGITYMDQELPPDKIVAALAAGFFVSLGVYSFNYQTDYMEDSINERSSAFIAGRKTASQILGFSFLCKSLAILSALMLGWIPFIIICTIVVLSFLYSYKIFGFMRLKELSGVKNLITSVSWAVLPTVPIFVFGFDIGPGLILLLLFLFLQILIGSMIGDMKDARGDAENQIITIPVILGGRAVALLYVLNLASLAILFLGILIGGLKTHFILLPLAVVWRHYTLTMIENAWKTMKYIYNYMNFMTYPLLALLAVIGRLFGI